MKNFTNNFKKFTSRLSARWLIMALMMLVGTSSAWAWGGTYRDVTNQPNESPTFYLGDKIAFYWILDNTGSSATYKKVYISTSSSNNASDWKYDLTWIKKDNDEKQYWKSSELTANATGTRYYSLWLGWGNSVGDNGRYYNGSSTTKTEGNGSFIKSSFSIKALPQPTNFSGTLSGTTATLNWTHDATYTNVLIVRYIKGTNPTSPVNGTNYNVNGKVGDGTVVYKGNANTCTNTITAGNSYDYYVYTINNNYYSSGVKWTLEGCTPTTLSWANTFTGNMKVGEDVSNPASLSDAAAANSISYTSRNPDVISVNGTTLTALKSGKATITASATPKDGFCSIESIAKEITVTCDVVNTSEIVVEVECSEGTPNIYYWGDDITTPEWPGEKMTGNNGVYTKSFATTKPINIIFYIKIGNTEYQTVDIKGLIVGKRYRYNFETSDSKDSDGKLLEDLLEEDCLAPACTTPNFSVELSNATVTKGDENITASITVIGTDSPAVTWSSSDEEVATIDADGKITAIKGGVTTISATTKGTDSYCKDTKKDAELTVKETPTIDITGDSYGCNEGKTLTATVECTTSYTVKWYKGSINTQAISTGSKYTATESGTYFAQVTGTYINTATSAAFVFTKYTPAAAPSISIGKESICSGETTNITIDGYSGANNYTLYKGNNTVQNPTFNNGVFTVSEAGTYFVTSTPKEGDCTLESAKQAIGLTLSVIEVTISLNPTSAPICSGTTLADIDTYVEITTNGDRVAWYEANSGGNALNEADEIRQATYYAEATLNGCTSERVSFNVTELLNVPAKPVITPSDAAICSGNTVTLTLTEKVKGETYKIGDISVFTSSNTYQPTLNETTTYTITATNQCGSTNSELVTINVTTTPVITANKLVTTIDSPITLTSNIDAIWTTTGGILNPNSGATSSVEFTSQNNGRYIITASNTANDITCSASKEVSVQNAFYVYIRRPKSGDNVYNDWYGKTNDAEKGNAPWFKEGTPNYDSMEDTNYGGVGPVESFTDCNDYTWDAFEFAGGDFYIHAPNTGGSDGWATFTKETYIESLSSDVYYYISSFTQNDKGSVLSESATKPERAPEIITPVTSLNPASGILCSGSQATLTVTNPQNDYTYTLMYKGTAQGEPISGNNEVEFTVIEAGSYAVQAKVQSNSGCTSTASSSASQIKVIATDIKFDATEYTTTPWVPVTVVIEVPSGYEFIYNDATLTSITPEADKPIKKENGHEYTYTFPRPTDWGIGNSQSGDGYDEKPYTITATIKNAEQCGTATATVKLQDEGNDKCILP